MELFPAIDIYDGKVVRLLKGEYDKMTVYGEDPVGTAQSFIDCGARWAHVVDLMGARDGECHILDIVRAMPKGISIEVGGGIRTERRIAEYIEAGARRVVLGTAAITDMGFTRGMIKKYGEYIAVGVDIKDGKAAVKGWTELSEKSYEDICAELDGMGLKTLICTEISRDGAMRGIDAEFYGRLSEGYGFDVTASGGVTSIDDIRALNARGLYGAIIGKALYTGDIDLKEALEAVK